MSTVFASKSQRVVRIVSNTARVIRLTRRLRVQIIIASKPTRRLRVVAVKLLMMTMILLIIAMMTLTLRVSTRVRTKVNR